MIKIMNKVLALIERKSKLDSPSFCILNFAT